MPFFVITTIDKPNSVDLRLASRPEHLDWLKAQTNLRVAGARWTDAAEPKPFGSTLIIEAENLTAARAWAAADPFAKAGLFAQTTVEEIRPAVGSWVAGA